MPRWGAPIGSLGLAVALSSQVLTSGSVLASQETGTFRDAAAVAEILRPRIDEKTRILLAGVHDAPLEYELARRGVAREVLRREPAAADRLFIVASAQAAQTPTLLVAEMPDPSDWSVRVKLAAMPGVIIYDMERVCP